MPKKKYSLRGELVGAVIIGLLCAFTAAGLFTTISDVLLGTYFDNPGYVAREERELIEKLQSQIDSGSLNPESSAELEAFFKDDNTILWMLVFDDGAKTIAGESTAGISDQNSLRQWCNVYKIRIPDGSAEVYLYTSFIDSVFYVVRNIVLAISFAVFIMVMLLLMSKKIRYINQIAREVVLLEGGNLDRPIRVSGNDELSRLAEGLDGMRISLRQQIAQEKDARRANSELITTLSHDLRTPLTTQMGYLEIIRDGHWDTPEQRDDYLNKCIANCGKLKDMSDRAFEYFLIGDRSNDEAQILLKDYDAQELLPQLFAEKGVLLEEKGFTFNVVMPKERFGLRLNMEYTFRIMNNIYSNLEKYAEPSEPVKITVELREGSCVMEFYNKLREGGEKAESTGIGLQSVAQLTKRQNGQLNYGRQGGDFFLTLRFPAI